MGNTIEHNPRFKYDCPYCKFIGTCGYLDLCNLKYQPELTGNLSDPPIHLQQTIDAIRQKKGISTIFGWFVGYDDIEVILI